MIGQKQQQQQQYASNDWMFAVMVTTIVSIGVSATICTFLVPKLLLKEHDNNDCDDESLNDRMYKDVSANDNDKQDDILGIKNRSLSSLPSVNIVENNLDIAPFPWEPKQPQRNIAESMSYIEASNEHRSMALSSASSSSPSSRRDERDERNLSNLRYSFRSNHHKTTVLPTNGTDHKDGGSGGNSSQRSLINDDPMSSIKQQHEQHQKQQQQQQLEFLASMTFANGGLRAPNCPCCY